MEAEVVVVVVVVVEIQLSTLYPAERVCEVEGLTSTALSALVRVTMGTWLECPARSGYALMKTQRTREQYI